MDDAQLRLEAVRIAQAQLPPAAPVEELLKEAAKIYTFLINASAL